jgi:hypothetical protein
LGLVKQTVIETWQLAEVSSQIVRLLLFDDEAGHVLRKGARGAIIVVGGQAPNGV